MISYKEFANAVILRRELHSNPELSGKETKTALIISEAIQRYQPDEIITSIGGHGVAFIFSGEEEGKTVLFRAELDALPIQEENSIEYKSSNDKISHSCGHDGHMAILTGLAQKINSSRPFNGKLILLFQPNEETGLGAKLVVHDRNFIDNIKPDYVFALHNLPGFAANSIVVKNNIFSSASIGLSVNLFGKSSHAAEPDNGISPTWAIGKIIKGIDEIQNNRSGFKDFVLATIVYISLGEKRFGTSPENGEVAVTLRSYRNDDLDILKNKMIQLISEICQKEKIIYEYSWAEDFLALENDASSNAIVRKAAHNLNLPTQELDVPFRWSEDFSWFTKKYKGAFFGLGSGEKQPALHNPDYNFPDEIIPSGVNMFFEIFKSINS